MSKKSLLKVTNLTKTFKSNDQEVAVIKNINCDIEEGDFTVIMGSSGSGKSTLLYLLSGLDGISSGTIDFQGEALHTQSEKQLSHFRRKHMGFVFQGIHLIPHMSLLENLLVPAYLVEPNKKKAKIKATEILQTLGLTDEQNRLPSQVSGGQAQRAAIGRGIINTPKILFADEPTGALNSAHGASVLDILSKLNRAGQSIIMVTHDIKAALRGNRILYLKDGQITSQLHLSPYHLNMGDHRETEVLNWLQEKGW